MKIKYNFSAKIWKYDTPNGWYFVSLPIPISKEIRENLKWQEEGWGRMKTKAEVGDIIWETAIWFDTKLNTYILPIKAEVRKKASLNSNQNIKVSIWV